MDELEEKGIEVYAISPASPEEHQLLKEEEDLDLEFLTDTQNLEFGQTFGFIQIGEEILVDRGYVGANPETEQMHIEVDYLFGDQYDEVMETLENL